MYLSIRWSDQETSSTCPLWCGCTAPGPEPSHGALHNLWGHPPASRSLQGQMLLKSLQNKTPLYPVMSYCYRLIVAETSTLRSHRHHPGCAPCRCSRCPRCVSSRGWLWTSCRSSGACVGPGPGPWSCPSRCRRCASSRGWWWSGETGVCDGTCSPRCCRWPGTVCPGGPCPAPERRWCTTPCTASSLESHEQRRISLYITDWIDYKITVFKSHNFKVINLKAKLKKV